MIGGDVTVVIAGHRVDASESAHLEGGIVVAPLDPFVRAFATTIVETEEGRRFTITRGSRMVSVTLGSTDAIEDGRIRALPAAPFAAPASSFVPLAAIARALGATVEYDGRSRTLAITTAPEPLVSMTPLGVYLTPTDAPTFAPKETAAPAPRITGIPRPRRTPIVVEPPV
jgi:hypothetical protein